jgi:hypothetical protein
MKEEFKQKEKESPMQANIRKAELAQKKRDADKSISDLIDRYIEADEKYGPDNFRTQMLGAFVDLVVPLKDIADVMTEMREAMGTLDDTLHLIDDTMNFMYDLMTIESGRRYTFMTRLKNRRKFKKFVKNNNSRLGAIKDSVRAMTDVSAGMRAAISGLGAWIKKDTARQKKKLDKMRAKEREKGRGEGGTGSFLSEGAQKLVEERRKALGGSSSSATTKPSAPKGGDNPADVSDIA